MNLFTSTSTKSRIVLYIAALLSLGAVLYPDWRWALASLAAFQFYWIVGLSVGNHRYFTHRAFETSRFWEEVMIWAACTSLSGPPGLYAIVHLEHHRLSDTPEDPHVKYSKEGFIGGAEVPFKISASMRRAFVSNPLMMRSYRLYLLYPILTALVLLAISPEAVIYLWAIPVIAMQVLRKEVTIKWVHRFGYVTHQTGDDSKNSKLLGLLFGGDGLHNNHHRYPQRWNFAMDDGEIDPGSWFVRLIKS